MPSAKRKLDHVQREFSKVAKTNRSISDFFGGSQTSTRVETSSTVSPVPDRRTVKAKHKYGYRQEWTVSRPWLFNKHESIDNELTEVMYCRLCKKHNSIGMNGSAVWVDKGCRTLRLDKVTAHEQSDQHQHAVKLEADIQMGIDRALSERQPLHEKEFQALVCASKLLHFLIKHNIPHTTVYEDLIDFAVEELKSPVLAHLQKGKNASYKSQHTADELLAAMSEDIECTLHQRVRESPAYAVLTDEATDTANKKHLAFCVKYVEKDTGNTETCFIKDVRIDNGKSETIFNEVKGLIEEDLRQDNFYGFGSDGCNAMVGKKTGVATRLKQIKPDLITVHCHNHRLALAAKDSFEELPAFRETDDLLSSLFRYYKSSGNRTRSLEKLQELLDDSGSRKIKQVAHTRWLSHLEAVTSLRDTYSAVIMDLENSVESGNDNVRLGSGPSANGLLKKLKTYQTVHIVHFLCDALRPLTSLALIFEKNDVDLASVKPRMVATILALQRLQTIPGINMKKGEKLLEELQITVDERAIDRVDKAEMSFLQNLTSNIGTRLDNPDIIDALSIFSQCHTGALSGVEELDLLADHYGLDIDQCMTEWEQLKATTVDIPLEDRQGPIATLRILATMAPTTGELFPNIKKLCSIAAIIPVSTAVVERVFSRVNRTVTDLRNRLKVDTVHKLLMIGINDSFLNFEEAVKRWHKQRPRRIKF